MNAVLGWHFSTADQRLQYGDGRLIVPGETLRHEGTLVLCSRGLHASERILDALKYAPGPYLWRVRLSGEIAASDDKLVASERTALWGVDATPVLRDFARRCALDVIHLWDAPPVVRQYLRTGDETIRAAARDAARAAWAAEDAAGDAEAAAWAAAWAAGDAAAAAAAWAAEAAGAAAWDAARDRQQRRLTALVWAEARRNVLPSGGVL